MYTGTHMENVDKVLLRCDPNSDSFSAYRAIVHDAFSTNKLISRTYIIVRYIDINNYHHYGSRVKVKKTVYFTPVRLVMRFSNINNIIPRYNIRRGKSGGT